MRREPAVRWFGLSFAPLSKHNERFARQYRCGPPPVSPDAGLLRLRSPSFQVLTFLVLLKPLSRSRHVHIHRHRHRHICIYIYIYIYKLSLCSVMLCNVVLCGSVSVSVSLDFSSPSPLPPLPSPLKRTNISCNQKY